MSTCRAERALPVVQISVPCTRLPGVRELPESACVARWLRSQRPAGKDPWRPQSLDACRRCPDGASRAGSQGPTPRARTAEAEAARVAMVRHLAKTGTATVAELAQAAREAGVSVAWGSVHRRLADLEASGDVVRVRVEHPPRRGRPSLTYAVPGGPAPPPPQPEARRSALVGFIRQQGRVRLVEAARHLNGLGFTASASVISKDLKALQRAGLIRREPVPHLRLVTDLGDLRCGAVYRPAGHPITSPPSVGTVGDTRRRLAAALEAAGGQIPRAAQLLGISRRTLYLWLDRYPDAREARAHG